MFRLTSRRGAAKRDGNAAGSTAQPSPMTEDPSPSQMPLHAQSTFGTGGLTAGITQQLSPSMSASNTIGSTTAMQMSKRANSEHSTGTSRDGSATQDNSKRTKNRPTSKFARCIQLLIFAAFVSIWRWNGAGLHSPSESTQAFGLNGANGGHIIKPMANVLIDLAASDGNGNGDNDDIGAQFIVDPPSTVHQAKQDVLQQCENFKIGVAAPRNGTDDHKAIWVPGFPGSGSELFRKIITSMTGLPAGDIYDSGAHRCSLYPATCKTHCPFLQDASCPSDLRLKVGCKKTCEKPLSYVDNYFDRQVWLLLRNPKSAIPSYQSWSYEARKDTATHIKQMPESVWKKRRNEDFMFMLKGWANTIKWWTRGSNGDAELPTMPVPRTGHPYNTSMIIPYEHLVSPIHGPKLLRRVGIRLARANVAIETVPKLTISANVEDDLRQWNCFWSQVVMNKNSTTKRSSQGRYVPSYRKGQQQKFLVALDALLERYTVLSPRHDLIPLLRYYRDDITTNLRLDS